MANTKIPDGWYRTTLGKVAKLTMGQSPASDTYNTEHDGLPFFQGKADFGSRYPKTRYWCSAPTKIIEEQSILFSVRAPVGDVNITPYECCIGRGLAGIQGDSVNQEFLFQKLQHAKPQFQLLSQGSTFEAVNGSDLKEFDLILPPLPEQQKIATILTSVDTVIEKTRAQIDKLKHLKTSMMQELLTKGIGHTEFKDSPVGKIPKAWEVGKIADLGKVVTGNTPKTTDSSNYDGNIPFISPADLGDAVYIETTKSSITEKGLLETRELPKGSVCVVCIGSTIGKTGITTKLSATNQQINSIVCKNNHSEFVYYLLSHYSNKIKTEAGTQAVPIINKSSFSALQVQIPPFEEQIK